MKSISIRNIPDNVYAMLQKIAKSNRRSLQEQVKFILEKEIQLVKGSPIAVAAQWRKRLKDRKMSDTVNLVRQDRQR